MNDPTESTSDDAAPPRSRLQGLLALWPGLLACALVAMASAFISAQYGGPLMLYALLFGIAFHFLSEEGRCRAGIEASARHVLRLGVALLGVRITAGEVMALGWAPVGLVVLGVTTTIAVGWLVARLMGLGREQGLLSGGAVAICGASAAMALSAVMPRSATLERNTILVVVSVTALSTLAMIVYPLIAEALALDARGAGLFLGATIHDVAQVVGAGYMISAEVGDTSALVKLMRVAMLVPVVLVFSLLLFRDAQSTRGGLAAGVLEALPGFLVAFVVLVAINSMGWLPAAVVGVMSDASRACLVTAIAALGMKTSFKDLLAVGWRPVILIVLETLFLCALALVVVTLVLR